MTEESIYNVAYAILQKYTEQGRIRDSHDIWCMAGEFLNQLIVPSGRHPLACRLMEDTVNFYCEQYKKAHAAA